VPARLVVHTVSRPLLKFKCLLGNGCDGGGSGIKASVIVPADRTDRWRPSRRPSESPAQPQQPPTISNNTIMR
jgi:hypothetical protein